MRRQIIYVPVDNEMVSHGGAYYRRMDWPDYKYYDYRHKAGSAWFKFGPRHRQPNWEKATREENDMLDSLYPIEGGSVTPEQ